MVASCFVVRKFCFRIWSRKQDDLRNNLFVDKFKVLSFFYYKSGRELTDTSLCSARSLLESFSTFREPEKKSSAQTIR